MSVSPSVGPGMDMDQDQTDRLDRLLEFLLVGGVGPTEGGNPVSCFLQVLKQLLCFRKEGVTEQLL